MLVDHYLSQHFQTTSADELYKQQSTAQDVQVTAFNGQRYLVVTLQSGTQKFIPIDSEAFKQLQGDQSLLSRMKNFLNSYLITTPIDAIKEAFQSGRACFQSIIQSIGHATTNEHIEKKLQSATQIVANSKMVLAGAQAQDNSKNQEKIVAQALEIITPQRQRLTPQESLQVKKNTLQNKRHIVRRIMRKRKKEGHGMVDERGTLLMERTRQIINECRTMLSRTISVCDAFQKEIFIICSCNYTSFTELWETQQTSIFNSLANIKKMGKQLKQMLQKAKNANLQINDFANVYLLIGAASESLIASQIMLCAKFTMLYYPPESQNKPQELKGYLQYITLEKDTYAQVWQLFLVARLCDKVNWSPTKKQAIKKVALQQLDSASLIKFTHLFGALQQAQKRSQQLNQPRILDTYLSATLTGKNQSFWGDAWQFLKSTSQKVGRWLGFKKKITEQQHAMTTSNVNLLEKNINQQNKKKQQMLNFQQQVARQIVNSQSTSLSDMQKKAVMAQPAEDAVLSAAKKNVQQKLTNQNITKAGQAMIQASNSTPISQGNLAYLGDLLNAKQITPQQGKNIYQRSKVYSVNSQFQIEFKPVQRVKQKKQIKTKVSTSSTTCKAIFNSYVSKLQSKIKISISKGSTQIVNRIIAGQLSLASQMKDFESKINQKINKLLQNSDNIKKNSSNFRQRIQSLQYQRRLKEELSQDSYKKIAQSLQNNIDTQQFVNKLDASVRATLMEQKANYDTLVKGIAEIKAGLDDGAKLISTSSPKFLSQISFNAYAVATNQTLGNLKLLANANTVQILQHFNSNAKTISQSVYQMRKASKAEHQSILQGLTFLTGTMQAQMKSYHQQYAKQMNQKFNIAIQNINQQNIQQYNKLQQQFQSTFSTTMSNFRVDILQNFNQNLKKQCGQILALVGQCFSQLKSFKHQLNSNFTSLQTFIQYSLKDLTNQTAILYNQIQGTFVQSLNTIRQGNKQLMEQTQKIQQAVVVGNFQQTQQNTYLSQQNKALNQGIKQIQNVLKRQQNELVEQNARLKRQLSFNLSNNSSLQAQLQKYNQLTNQYRKLQESFRQLQITKRSQNQQIKFLLNSAINFSQHFQTKSRLANLSDLTLSLEAFGKQLERKGYKQFSADLYDLASDRQKELDRKIYKLGNQLQRAKADLNKAERAKIQSEKSIVQLKKAFENQQYDSQNVMERAKYYDILLTDVKNMKETFSRWLRTPQKYISMPQFGVAQFSEVMNMMASEIQRSIVKQHDTAIQVVRLQNELRMQQEAKKNEMKKLAKKARDAEQQLKQNREDMSQFKQRQAKLTGEIQLLQQSKKYLTETQQKHRQTSQQIKNLQRTLQQVRSRQSQAQIKNNKLSQQLAQTRTKLLTVQSEKDGNDVTIQQLTRLKAAAQKKLHQYTTKIIQKKGHADKIKNTYGGLQYQDTQEFLLAQMKQFSALKFQHANTIQNLNKLTKQYQQLKSEYSNKNNKIEHLNGIISGLQVGSAVVSTQKQDTQRRIRELQKAVNQAKMQAESYGDIAKKTNLQSIQLKGTINQKQIELKHAKGQMKKKDIDIEDLNNELQQQRATHARLKKGYQQIMKEKKKMQEELQRYVKIQKQYKQNILALEEIQSKMRLQTQKLDKLKKDNSKSQIQNRHLLQQVDRIVDRVRPQQLRTALFKNKFTQNAIKQEDVFQQRLKMKLTHLTDQILSLDKNSTDWNKFLQQLRRLLGLPEQTITLPDNQIAEIAIDVIKNQIQQSKKRIKKLQEQKSQNTVILQRMKYNLQEAESQLVNLKARNSEQVQRHKRQNKQLNNQLDTITLLLNKNQVQLQNLTNQYQKKKNQLVQKQYRFQQELNKYENFQKQKKMLLKALTLNQQDSIISAIHGILKLLSIDIPIRSQDVEDEAYLFSLIQLIKSKQNRRRNADDDENDKPSKRINDDAEKNNISEKNNVTINISLNTEGNMGSSGPPPPPPNLPLSTPQFAVEAKTVLQLTQDNDVERLTKDLNQAKKLLSQYEHIFIVMLTKLIKLVEKITQYIQTVQKRVIVKTAQQKLAVDLFIKFMGQLLKWGKTIFQKVSFTDFINDYISVKHNLKMFSDAYNTSLYINSFEFQQIKQLIHSLNNLVLSKD